MMANQPPGSAGGRSRDEVHSDRLFGEIAIRLFMTTRRDLDRALRAQREAREAGGDPTLGEVMVALQLLTPQQVALCLGAQGVYDEKSVETLYGRLAVKNGFLSQANLDTALQIQERTGRRLRIGEILVKKGFLTWEQHEAILRSQERLLEELEKKRSGGLPGG